MFLNIVGKPTKIKKITYLVLSVILGLLLSFDLHALIEIKYLQWAFNQGLVARFYGGCALPPVLQIGLIFFGGIGGFFLGKFWWQKVYIERFWEKKKS